MSKFSKNDYIVGLKAEREALFERFAEAIIDYAKRNGTEIEYAGELYGHDEHLLAEFMATEEGRSFSKAIHADGALDFLTVLNDIHAGVDLMEIWPIFAPEESVGAIQNQAYACGLHNLHFRSNMQDMESQCWATTLLSRFLTDHHSEAARNDDVFPLRSLSMVITDDFTYEIKHAVDAQTDYEDDNDEVFHFTQAELDKMLGLYTAKKWEVDDSALESGIDKLISSKGVFAEELSVGKMLKPFLAKAIEEGLIPMVYNHGYRLKATMPISNHDLREELNPIIDTLLGRFEGSPAFTAALKRQIFINLFSAFPKGLEMFDVKPGELQGVITDEALLNDPSHVYFLKTLMGPVALFSQVDQDYSSTSASAIVNFLNEAGYPIDVDVAAQGLMMGTPELSKLIVHSNGESEFLNQHFQSNKPIGREMSGAVRALLTKERLEHYSDEIAVKVIESYFKHRDNRVRDIPDFKAILSARPALVKPALEILKNTGNLDQDTFKACGFGSKELRLLGKYAPDDLAESMLGGDLGL